MESDKQQAAPQKVTVVDFDMGFGQMIVFMVKLAFAAIPATIIFIMLMVFALGIIGAILPNPYF